MSDDLNTHYGEINEPEPHRVCQNYSQMQNNEMASRVVDITNPHLRGATRTTFVTQVQALLDRELTRMYGDVSDFHHKFRLDYGGSPRVLPDDLEDFRVLFMGEELEEYAGLPKGQLVNALKAMLVERGRAPDTLERREMQLDALVDLAYVLFGTAYLQGFNFAEAWRRVHTANMSKVRTKRPEDSKRGSGYDVVKPEGWTPPSHADLVGVLGSPNGVADAEGPGESGLDEPTLRAVGDDLVYGGIDIGVVDHHAQDAPVGYSESEEPDHGLF